MSDTLFVRLGLPSGAPVYVNPAWIGRVEQNTHPGPDGRYRPVENRVRLTSGANPNDQIVVAGGLSEVITRLGLVED